VSSAALEEGIDVPECGFVIRYTSIVTTKAHIQGSGRARHPNAVVYYFENNPVQEQQKEAYMTATAKDKSLSLSSDELKNAALSMSSTVTPRHPYPTPPLGMVSASNAEGEVNVFNCKQIFNQYCSVTLGTTIQPKKDLYRYANLPGDRKVLSVVRYPTPMGWQSKSSADYQEFWRDINVEDVFSSAERVKRKSASDKEEMCFVYLVVVHLRQMGFLDAHNRPDRSMEFEARRCCSLQEKDWSEAISIKNTIFQSSKES